MKYLFSILIIFSTYTFANDNSVLSGKAVSTTGFNIPKDSFVSELSLKNCDVNLTSIKQDNMEKVKISFSNRVFIANSVTIKPQKDGTCVLALIKGIGVS